MNKKLKCPECNSPLKLDEVDWEDKLEYHYCSNNDCETQVGGTIKVPFSSSTEVKYGEPYYE